MSITGSEAEDLPADHEVYAIQSVEGEYHEDYQEFVSSTKHRTEDFISRPFFSKGCDIEENILELDYSYGYDCKKPYNLVPMDERIIIFASGNLIHFFDVETREVWFRRSARGGGIGHITKNPNPNYWHIAVGEKGTNPLIIIYEWPTMEIICVLENGTTKNFAHLNYSPDGELLVSQGGEPDYLLTIWDWPKSTILLRAKSYMNDVLRVMFSPEVPGQLTSCGLAHIKFWKMVETFTGKKLQGELGRFGKTEYSDIVGIYPMADEKVISGCYWGNILVWEEGLVKLEVCRKNRKRCHDGPIVQFDYKNGELWTVSMDGRVRLWYYDTIDQADPPEDDRVVQMEPTYDFHTPGAEFMCIVKQSEDPEDTYYFAQDGRGGIWKIDLTIETDARPSERLLKSHAGVAKDLSVCPWGPYFTTIGIGGRLHLYNYLERRLLYVYLFPAKGSCLIWVPMHVDPSGEVLICACDDGAIRVCIYKIDLNDGTNSKLHVIQIIKPHNKPIIKITMNNPGTLFISGAEDKTIFVFKVEVKLRKYLNLVQIGYVKTPGVPTCFLWDKISDNKIMVGCRNGYFLTVEVPKQPVKYTTITFELQSIPIIQRFTSCKSQIRRNILLKEIEVKKAEKRARKAKELEKLKKENPGIDIDEEIYLADSEEDVEFGPLYIPETPNEIIWMKHTPEDTIWLSLGGYDAGYIYEYKIGEYNDCERATIICGGDDIEIRNYCYSKNHDFLICAMQDGSLRVNRINPHNWRDLSNYWQLTMHDNQNGNIPGMGFTYDESYFLTCGYDGNVFAFKFNPDNESYDTESIAEREIPTGSELKPVEDKPYYGVLTLEETIVKAELDRINMVANRNKQWYLDQIEVLREEYEELLERNKRLPKSQRIKTEEVNVDPRIINDLEDTCTNRVALAKKKVEYKIAKSGILMNKLKDHFLGAMGLFPIMVKAVRQNISCECIRQAKLGENFEDQLREVDKKIAESELKGRPPERLKVEPIKYTPPPKSEPKLEHFLTGLSPEVIKNKLGVRINRLLTKFRERRQRREKRNLEWAEFNAQKPQENVIDPEDEKLLKEAEDAIGDLKLKTDPDYKVPPHLRESTFKKFKSLLLTRKQQYHMVRTFNTSIYVLRQKKAELHKFLVEQTNILNKIHFEIEPDERIFGPEVFDFGGAEDYPEKEFEVKKKRRVGKDGNKKIVPPTSGDLLQYEILLPKDHVEPIEDESLSKWEIEILKQRHRDKAFEQHYIIKAMYTAIDEFDELVVIANKERVDVCVDHSLITLHLLTQNEELMILKECENKEEALSEKVHEKMFELMDLQDNTAVFNKDIDLCKKELSILQEKEKEIQQTFLAAAQESKFFDFLRKIFKKKYRPPKLNKEDESDSESSSSSSDDSDDEDDAGSIDSKDFNIVRLDENVCPKGCDQNLYELTFTLRSQRHVIEAQIKEQNTKIDSIKKECEGYNKRIRVLEEALRSSQNDLENFIREKQFKLNEIYCTIILNEDQLQHFDDDGTLVPVDEMLVISEDTIPMLNARIEELEQETVVQRSKYQVSIDHLKRMKHDIDFMSREIDTIKEKIDEKLKYKFGCKVDVDELEECMLKKLVYDLKLSMLDCKGMLEREKERWNKIVAEKKEQLKQAYRRNTEAKDLFRLLQKERNDLVESHNTQTIFNKKLEHVTEEAEKLKNSVQRLKVVIKDQVKEIETLKREIKFLKTKGFVPKKDEVEEADIKEEYPVDEDDFSVMERWEELDDYMYTENYAREYWAQKEQRHLLKTRQEVILSVIGDLFANIKIQIEHNAVQRILKKAISDILNKNDVQEILAEILQAMPEKLTDEQQSLIELSVEKLSSLDDLPSMAEENLGELSDIFERILYDVEENVSDQIYFEKLIGGLAEKLPLSFILKDQNIQQIAMKTKKRIPLKDPGSIENLKDKIKLETFEARAVFSEIINHIVEENKKDENDDKDDEESEISSSESDENVVVNNPYLFAGRDDEEYEVTDENYDEEGDYEDDEDIDEDDVDIDEDDIDEDDLDIDEDELD